MTIARRERRSPRGAHLKTALGKTVAIVPRRVDALSSATGKTVVIPMVSELVARVGGVARKGAAELASAPDEREC